MVTHLERIIIHQIKSSKYFTVTADKTTEQRATCYMYLMVWWGVRISLRLYRYISDQQYEIWNNI